MSIFVVQNHTLNQYLGSANKSEERKNHATWCDSAQQSIQYSINVLLDREPRNKKTIFGVSKTLHLIFGVKQRNLGMDHPPPPVLRVNECSVGKHDLSFILKLRPRLQFSLLNLKS